MPLIWKQGRELSDYQAQLAEAGSQVLVTGLVRRAASPDPISDCSSRAGCSALCVHWGLCRAHPMPTVPIPLPPPSPQTSSWHGFYLNGFFSSALTELLRMAKDCTARRKCPSTELLTFLGWVVPLNPAVGSEPPRACVLLTHQRTSLLCFL